VEGIFTVLAVLVFLAIGGLMVAGFLTAAVFLFRYVLKRRNAWTDLLRQFAASNDLHFEAPAFPKGPGVTGKLAEFPVCIDTYSSGSGKSQSLYSRITMSPEIPPDLQIHRETYFTELGQKLMGEDLQIGLPLFDDTFVLKGVTTSLALSLLGTTSRDALWRTVRDGSCAVADGDLTYTKSGYIKSEAELGAQVELLKELAAALTEFAHRPAVGLLHHATEDPEPTYRARCLQALLSDFPASDEAAKALVFAAESTDLNFQFIYQRHQDKPNLDVIAGLIRSGELDEPLHLAARDMLEGRFAGGLSLGSDEDIGGLSVAQDGSGALSEPSDEGRPPAKKKRSRGESGQGSKGNL
jgi:hypothetical protein